jgi:hypothetical protein
MNKGEMAGLLIRRKNAGSHTKTQDNLVNIQVEGSAGGADMVVRSSPMHAQGSVWPSDRSGSDRSARSLNAGGTW